MCSLFLIPSGSAPTWDVKQSNSFVSSSQVFSTVEATLLPVVEGDILAKLMTVIDSSCGVKIITKGDDLGLCGSWEDVNAARETLAEVSWSENGKICHGP